MLKNTLALFFGNTVYSHTHIHFRLNILWTASVTNCARSVVSSYMYVEVIVI